VDESTYIINCLTRAIVLCLIYYKIRSKTLWWIPWDRGRKTLNLNVTHTFNPFFTVSVRIKLPSTYQELHFVMISIQILFGLRDSWKKTSICRIAFSLVYRLNCLTKVIVLCLIHFKIRSKTLRAY